MNDSPLNYSDVGYDFACNDTLCMQQTQVHADGEIWSETNYDVRQAFIARYGAGNPALQVSCARGDTAVTSCPGNRRWIQLVYDAWLLMPSGPVSMVDARNAMIAADQIRFNGVNGDILWNVFAHRGLGQGATSNGTADFDPVPAGATATGDGSDPGALIDDTEATNWASLGSPAAGKQVTVRLDPSRTPVTFRRVQVSALLRTPAR